MKEKQPRSTQVWPANDLGRDICLDMAYMKDECDPAALKIEAKAEQVAPLQRPGGKKGKKFADTTCMLSFVDDANRNLEAKATAFFEREGEILRRISQRDKQREAKKASRTKKLDDIKERMRNKRRSAIDNSKGKHNKENTGDDKSDDERHTKHKGKPASRSGKPSSSDKKRVTFKK